MSKKAMHSNLNQSKREYKNMYIKYSGIKNVLPY